MEEQKKQESSVLRDPWKALTITSDAFKQFDAIPRKFTCEGENIMPPLTIEEIPEEAKSLALIIDDPDAPSKTFVHYVAWNIPLTSHIPEGASLGTEGANDFSKHAYGGPCPPSGKHRYFFKLYALNDLLQIPPSSTKQDLEMAMNNHIVGFGELMGVYEKKR